MALSPGMVAPAQHLNQPLTSLPEDCLVSLPVEEAGPGVGPVHDGRPQVGRTEQG